MIPHLNLFFVSVPTHQFFVGVAVIIFTIIVFNQFHDKNYSSRTYLLIPSIALGAIAGSWLSMLIPTHSIPYDAGVAKLFLYSGRSLVGGLAGAYIFAQCAKKIFSITTVTGNAFAYACAPAFAVGRIGCFLTEPLGTPSHLPWAIRLSKTQALHIYGRTSMAGIAMHPSMLYEIIFFVVMTITLFATRKVSLPSQFRWRTFMFSYAIFRFFVEFVRENRNIVWGLSGTQVFIACAFPLITYAMIREIRLLRKLRSLPKPTIDRMISIQQVSVAQREMV